jgi:hypothetical protein
MIRRYLRRLWATIMSVTHQTDEEWWERQW